MPIIEVIEAVQSEKPSNDETLSNAIAATAKPKSRAKRSAKSKESGKRFTLEEAAAYYSEQSGKPMSAATLKANAKKYGFEIRERGSGLYALIDG